MTVISLPPVSAQIRRLRQDQGLTLSDLAERVGTSAPTMHRYESGWDRFEIRTLEKIAVALGARLELRLVPATAPATQPEPDLSQVVESLSPLFWDQDLVASNLADHPEWVLARVLTLGSMAQVRIARAWFGDDAIRNAIRRREVDARTRNFWNLILD
jgi:transcriptional regulator with XRE-family HTH domain